MPISNGASPIASALGIRLGATPRGRIHPNIQPQKDLPKPDISTLLGLGHFYFALTGLALLLYAIPLPMLIAEPRSHEHTMRSKLPLVGPVLPTPFLPY